MDHPDVDPYAPCPCGSGKKFKFCCRNRECRAGPPDVNPPIATSSGTPPLLLHLAPLSGNVLAKARESFAQGERCLHAGRFAQARRHFEATLRLDRAAVPACNNLALCEYMSGNIDAAIRIEEDVLQRLDPRNGFALGSLIQYYAVAGREADARAAAGRLQDLEAGDPSALYKICEALARLGLHDALLAFIRKSPLLVTAETLYLAAVACANLSRFDEARLYLKDAVVGKGGYQENAVRMLRRIEAGRGPATLEGDWPYFGMADWAPVPLTSLVDRLPVTRNPEEAAKEGGRRWPILAEFARAVLDESEGKATEAVDLLAMMDTPRALEILRKIALGTFGTDELRLAALTALLDRGALAESEPVKVWRDGRWTEFRPKRYAITPEAARPITPALRPLYERWRSAAHGGRLEEAEAVCREIIPQEPDNPVPRQNLAAALYAQGRKSDAETVLREIMALDPHYVFAPVTLADIRVQEGRLEEARKILEDFRMPDEVHPDAYATYLTVKGRVELLDDNLEDAMACLDTAKKMAPDLQAVQALDHLLKKARPIHAVLQRIRRREEERREKQRSRLLAADATLEQCYAAYDRDELLDMARAIGVRRVGRLAKDALRGVICDLLRKEFVVRECVGFLSKTDKAALRDLSASGGRQAFEAFTRKYGTEVKKELSENATRTDTILGRLKAHGLVVEGTINGAKNVMIPREIAPAVKAQLVEPADSGWCRRRRPCSTPGP